MRAWDVIVIFALMFTAFVTPYEVAFFEAALYSGPINFTFNRLVDTIFIVDIVVNFFMPYRASQQRGGMMVYDNKLICRAYLRGWFALDLFTCIPFGAPSTRRGAPFTDAPPAREP